jgi:hypothetical protein
VKANLFSVVDIDDTFYMLVEMSVDKGQLDIASPEVVRISSTNAGPSIQFLCLPKVCEFSSTAILPFSSCNKHGCVIRRYLLCLKRCTSSLLTSSRGE